MSAVIVGLPQLQAKLARLVAAMSGPATGPALVAGASLVASAWQAGAPVLTGGYLASIHVEPADTGATTAEAAALSDITEPPYPAYLEYGTSKMAARPSAGPAFDQAHAAALALITSILRAQLLRAV